MSFIEPSVGFFRGTSSENRKVGPFSREFILRKLFQGHLQDRLSSGNLSQELEGLCDMWLLLHTLHSPLVLTGFLWSLTASAFSQWTCLDLGVYLVILAITCMAALIPSAFHIHILWILTINLQGMFYDQLHFTDEGTETERGEVSCPRSHGWEMTELVHGARPSGSTVHFLS